MLPRPAARHVILTRDDTGWLGDLDLAGFSQPATVHSRRQGVYCTPKVSPVVPNDNAFVMDGDAADRLLRLRSAFFRDPDPAFDAAWNVEDFFLTLARVRGLRWRFVSDDAMPFGSPQHSSGGPQWDP